MFDIIYKKNPILTKINAYNISAFFILAFFIYGQTIPIQVSRPHTMWVALLAILLPGIWRLAKIVLSQAGFTGGAASILTPAITLAIWIASIHLTGLIFGNFYLGLIVSNVTLGLAGYLLPGSLVKFKYQLPDEKHVYVALLNCFIISPVVLLTDWHDTHLISGHFSLSEQLLNGFYPPHHLTFAEVVHPSHYGINILYASVASVFALSVESSIDITTFIMWFYVGLLCGYIVKTLFGEKGSAIGVFVSCFASGFPLIAFFYADSFDSYKRDVLVGLLTFIPPKQANQPISHFFFQHPFSIGLPVFLSLVTAFFVVKEKDTSSKIYYGIIALLLFILGIGNTTLFMATMGALCGCIFMQIILKDNFKLIICNSITIVCVIIGFVLFSGAYETVSGGVKGSIIFAEKPMGGDIFRTILWNIDNLGLLLILSLVSLCKLKEYRLFQFFVLFLILGSLFVINFLTYRYSHDIIKFSVIANIVAAIFAVYTINYLKDYNKYLSYVLMAVICFNGAMFPFTGTIINPFEDEGKELKNVYKLHENKLSEDAADTMEWLRSNIKNTEIVLQVSPRDLHFAMHAGIASFRPDWGAKSFAFSREHIALREDMLLNPSKYQAGDYYKQGVRWIVTKENGKDPLAPLADRWEKDGSIKNIKTFGDYKIYQITESSL